MITSNSASLLQRVQLMVDSLGTTVSGGINKAVEQVNKAARKNLSGARDAAPWTYPVPRRSGGLLLNQKAQRTTSANPYTGFVFNMAPYAQAIHNGFVSQWAGRGKHSMRMKSAPRPFLDDAVESEQPLMIIQRDIETQWLPQWT